MLGFFFPLLSLSRLLASVPPQYPRSRVGSRLCGAGTLVFLVVNHNVTFCSSFLHESLSLLEVQVLGVIDFYSDCDNVCS